MPEKLSQGPRVGYDSRVGAGLSRGPNQKKTLVAAAWSETWPQPGSTLDLDFANNRGWVRGVGQGGVMDAITFTRASTGTFVNEQGLLEDAEAGQPRFDWASTEQEPRNLLLFTEDFDNAAWIKDQITVSGSKLIPTTTSTVHGIFQDVPDIVDRVLQIEAKADGYDHLCIGSPLATGPHLTVDLSSGNVVRISGNVVSYNIEDVGDGYWRISLVLSSAARYEYYLYVTQPNGIGNPAITWAGDGTSGVLVRKPQHEAGFVANAYVQVGAQSPTNTPLRPTPTSNGLLIEVSRTNRLLRNRDATQTQWVKTDVTAALDQTGIDGVANAASSLTATANGGTCIQTITLASGARTGSVYLKRLTGTGIVQVSLDGTTWSTADLSDTEWRRIVLSGTVTNPTVGIRLATSGDAVAMDYGQVEDGTSATTPIFTTGATATRSSDVASMTGVNFSSWFREDGGTIFSEGEMRFGTPTIRAFNIDKGPVADFIYVSYESVGRSAEAGSIRTNNVVQTSFSSFTAGVINRSVLSYRINDVSCAANGLSFEIDNSALIPTNLSIARIIASQTTSGIGTIKRVGFIPNWYQPTALAQISNLKP